MNHLRVKQAALLEVGDWIWGAVTRSSWPQWHGVSVATPYEFTGDNHAHSGVVIVGPNPMDLIADVPCRTILDQQNRNELLRAHKNGGAT